MEERYKLYDEIVSLILLNIVSEYSLCKNQIIIWNFNPENPLHQLYFNVAAIFSDLNKTFLYIQTDFFTYLKLKWKRRKVRKNLRYLTKSKAESIPKENQTQIETILNYIKETKNLDSSIFEEINKAYYGWVK